MPRPVFPVVRLPYDQPDRVARVLDTVRREFTAASQRLQQPAAAANNTETPTTTAAPLTTIARGTAMTAAAITREPETTAAGCYCGGTESVVDQVIVGVRHCTLTPKPKPDIFVSAGDGGVVVARNSSTLSADDVPGPYLLVPPVNITAEISRPPLTRSLLQYTS